LNVGSEPYAATLLLNSRYSFTLKLGDQGDKNFLFALHADPHMQTSYAPGPRKWTVEGTDLRLTGYMAEQASFGLTKWKLSL
jgi:hypothetical protein